MLQTGSLFLLYLEARAEVSQISIGTRCIPKHTSVARKKLPNKEPGSHNTEHEALFWASLQSSSQEQVCKPSTASSKSQGIPGSTVKDYPLSSCPEKQLRLQQVTDKILFILMDAIWAP